MPDDGRAERREPAPSALETLRLLCRRVHGDPALQAQLFALTDQRDFVHAVVALAHAQQLELDEETVLQAMRAGRRRGRKLP